MPSRNDGNPTGAIGKFFEIEVVIDVRTACDNGAKRNWEAIGLDAAQVSEERLLHALGGGFCRGQRYG